MPATSTSPRALPFLLALICLVTLVIALFHTPVGEWGGSSYLFGGVLLVISVLWLFLGFRGSYSLMGNMGGRGGVILSGIGVVAAGIVAGTTIFSDNWDVQNILMTGLWISLGVMFVFGFDASYKKMKAGG